MPLPASVTRRSDLEDESLDHENDPLAYTSDMLSYDSGWSSHESDPLLQEGSYRGAWLTRLQCYGFRWGFEQVVMFLLALLILMLMGLYFVLRWVKQV